MERGKEGDGAERRRGGERKMGIEMGSRFKKLAGEITEAW